MQRFYSNTLMLSLLVLALAFSLALIAATWLMVSHLLLSEPIAPPSWIGFMHV